MGAQEAAPAHTHGCEHGYGVAIYPPRAHKVGHQTERRAHSTERSDGECHLMSIREAEQEVQRAVQMVGQRGQQFNALIGLTRVGAMLAGAEREHHNKGGDDENARNDRHTYIYSRLATV